MISRIGTFGANAASGAVSVAHGLTMQAGDVIVAMVYVNRDYGTADNNGAYAFTEDIHADAPGAYDGHGMGYLFHRIAGASEPSSYAFTNTANAQWAINGRVYRGVDPSVWDVAPSTALRIYTNGLTPVTIPFDDATYDFLVINTAGACGLMFIADDYQPSNCRFVSMGNSWGTLQEQYGHQFLASLDRLNLPAGDSGQGALLVNNGTNAGLAGTGWFCALKPAPEPSPAPVVPPMQMPAVNTARSGDWSRNLSLLIGPTGQNKREFIDLIDIETLEVTDAMPGGFGSLSCEIQADPFKRFRNELQKGAEAILTEGSWTHFEGKLKPITGVKAEDSRIRIEAGGLMNEADQDKAYGRCWCDIDLSHWKQRPADVDPAATWTDWEISTDDGRLRIRAPRTTVIPTGSAMGLMYTAYDGQRPASIAGLFMNTTWAFNGAFNWGIYGSNDPFTYDGWTLLAGAWAGSTGTLPVRMPIGAYNSILIWMTQVTGSNYSGQGEWWEAVDVRVYVEPGQTAGNGRIARTFGTGANDTWLPPSIDQCMTDIAVEDGLAKKAVVSTIGPAAPASAEPSLKHLYVPVGTGRRAGIEKLAAAASQAAEAAFWEDWTFYANYRPTTPPQHKHVILDGVADDIEIDVSYDDEGTPDYACLLYTTAVKNVIPWGSFASTTDPSVSGLRFVSNNWTYVGIWNDGGIFKLVSTNPPAGVYWETLPEWSDTYGPVVPKRRYRIGCATRIDANSGTAWVPRIVAMDAAKAWITSVDLVAMSAAQAEGNYSAEIVAPAGTKYLCIDGRWNAANPNSTAYTRNTWGIELGSGGSPGAAWYPSQPTSAAARCALVDMSGTEMRQREAEAAVKQYMDTFDRSSGYGTIRVKGYVKDRAGKPIPCTKVRSGWFVTLKDDMDHPKTLYVTGVTKNPHNMEATWQIGGAKPEWSFEPDERTKRMYVYPDQSPQANGDPWAKWRF